MALPEIIPVWIRETPDNLKTQEMCKEVVRNNQWSLCHVPDNFKTQEMCEKAVEAYPWQLKYVPNCFKTKTMCKILFKMNHGRH